MFPFAWFIEKFLKIFTKAHLVCTREVSQCGREEKYLCYVCHTASEHDLLLLFKVWLSYCPTFHQVLNEKRVQKQVGNHFDHINMLSDGEGCTCWGDSRPSSQPAPAWCKWAGLPRASHFTPWDFPHLQNKKMHFILYWSSGSKSIFT